MRGVHNLSFDYGTFRVTSALIHIEQGHVGDTWGHSTHANDTGRDRALAHFIPAV